MTAGLRVAITGASGFVGSRLTRHFLGVGATVTAIVRQESDIAYLEQSPGAEKLRLARLARDYANVAAILREAEPDAVIHLAACTEGGDDEGATRRLVDANLLFPSLILSAMRAAGGRVFINTGSSWQHAENAAYRPFNLYAATKHAFEQVLTHHVEAGLSAATLRLFDVYGPDDPRPKFVNLLKSAAGAAEPLATTLGEQKIDLVHVDDVCRAYEAALRLALATTRAQHEVFAVASGRQISLRELVAIFETARGVRCNLAWGKRAYREREIMTPYAGLSSVPGWCPRIALEDGLREF